ncbi:MAG: carbohydrate ABC transporter permease, partial [Acinetobacter sp.]
KYPLQSYLQTIVVSSQQLFKNGRGNDNMVNLLKIINNDTSKAAQLFLGMLPVLLIYPLLQKYFTTGLTAGAIKE